MPGISKNKLIVALDVDSAAGARELVASLRDVVGMFKIGMQLFTKAGPALVREIIDGGSQVFLDLKYHDIPNTVAAAGVEAGRLGVSIFNVHAAGGSEMMSRTLEAVTNASEREGFTRPKIIGVTVLTSADAAVLSEIGMSRSPADQVIRMAQLTAKSGLDGVVASPMEVVEIRQAVAKTDFLILTPGVRSATSDANDQRRTMSPGGAVRAGSDFLVVGRPIIEARDPSAAARAVLVEIEAAAAGQNA
ncbi:MAG TPA: orotidine-5'-phosphate decarboxylase [Pyrinomonadaceae bacterium]|nr:orotidine-5'-phosphate decarboxylase [Pyrinomonadaceae bacterium]